MTMNPIPSPVAERRHGVRDERVPRQQPQGHRLADARANHRTPALAWSIDRDTPYVPSPLLYDGIIYILKTNSGVLSAFDAKTGKPHYQVQRLEGVPNVFSSPVAAAGPHLHRRPGGHDRGRSSRARRSR